MFGIGNAAVYSCDLSISNPVLPVEYVIPIGFVGLWIVYLPMDIAVVTALLADHPFHLYQVVGEGHLGVTDSFEIACT